MKPPRIAPKMAWGQGSQMAYRESSISPVILVCPPNFVRDRPYCFTCSPNHEEHHQSLMLRASFLHHENTQSVQTGILTPNLRIGVPACYNHKATAALRGSDPPDPTTEHAYAQAKCGFNARYARAYLLHDDVQTPHSTISTPSHALSLSKPDKQHSI